MAEYSNEQIFEFLNAMATDPSLKGYTEQIMQMLGFNHVKPDGEIYINKKEFEKLCILQCTKKDILGFFNLKEDEFDRWCMREYGLTFEEVFRMKHELGKVSLRRKQWALADKNAAVAIFLGKNYLNQTDQQAVEVKGELGLTNLVALVKECEDGKSEAKVPE